MTIHDFGVTTTHRAFLVMERLEGQTLRAGRRAPGRSPRDRVLAVVSDLCDVLSAAHARGLVHRDMKPENVFLARVGGPPTTKVLDFGIAKVLTGDEDATGRDTATACSSAHVPYMAPEQLRGEPVQPAWDLWALAVMTHEMFTGHRPRGVPAGARRRRSRGSWRRSSQRRWRRIPARVRGSAREAFEAALTGALAFATRNAEGVNAELAPLRGTALLLASSATAQLRTQHSAFRVRS